MLLLLSIVALAAPAPICAALTDLDVTDADFAKMAADADLSVTCPVPRDPPQRAASDTIMLGVAIFAMAPLGLSALSRRNRSAPPEPIGLTRLAAKYGMVGRLEALVDAGAPTHSYLLDQAVSLGAHDLVAQLADQGDQLGSLDLPAGSDPAAELAFLDSVGLTLPCALSHSTASLVVSNRAPFDAAGLPAACQLWAAEWLPAEALDDLFPRLLTDRVAPPVMARLALDTRLATDGTFDRAAALAHRWGPPLDTVGLRRALWMGDLDYAGAFLKAWGAPRVGDDWYDDDRQALQRAAAHCGPAGLELLAQHGVMVQEPTAAADKGDIESALGVEWTRARPHGLGGPLAGLLAFDFLAPDDVELVAWLRDGTPTQRALLLAHRQPDPGTLASLLDDQDESDALAGIIDAGAPPTRVLMEAAVAAERPAVVAALVRAGLEADSTDWHRWTCTLHEPELWVELKVPLSDAACTTGGVPNVLSTAVDSERALKALGRAGLDLQGPPGVIAMDHLVAPNEDRLTRLMNDDFRYDMAAALDGGLVATPRLAAVLVEACEVALLERVPSDALSRDAWKELKRAAPSKCRTAVRDVVKAAMAVGD